MGDESERPISFVIVDDDADGILITGHLLEDNFPGCRVTTFNSGAAAIEHLTKTRDTSLVVSNCSMLEMDGLELIRKLRDCDVKVPIILASSRPGLTAEALEAGANAFVDALDFDGLVRAAETLLQER